MTAPIHHPLHSLWSLILKRSHSAGSFKLLWGMLLTVCTFPSLALAQSTKETTTAPDKKAADRRPNIVFFLVDDMGWQDTSVPFHTEPTPLNQKYRTPNMERLAAEGVKFTQAYACPLCSPTRVSWMTGLNAARHRVTNWTLRKDRSPSGGNKTVKEPDWNLNGLSPVADVPRTIHTVTLPQLLQQAGYTTIHVGKAHFGAKDTPGENPLSLGFDVNIAGHAAGGPGSYSGLHNFSAAWRSNELIWNVPGLEKYHGQDINLTEALTLEANQALEKAVAGDKPFFLYMSHYTVHAPWEKDDRFFAQFKDAQLPGVGQTLASMLMGMDKSLGDIRAKLNSLGVAENTIIVFMSDNGAPKNVPANLPLRGHKISCYEGGTRVPMLVYWPGVTKPAAVRSDYLIIEDLFPTFLELAGVSQIPEHDGVSLVPLFRGENFSKEASHRPLVWHYPNTYDQPPFSSIRVGDWKLIYHHMTQKLALYNLADDLSEKTDLVTKNPQKTRELAETLAGRLRAMNAQLPILRATNKPIPWPDEIPVEGT